MDAMTRYLDGVEAQVCRDGFMTHSMRRHLHELHRFTDDPEAGRRIERMVALYNIPYVLAGGLRHQATMGTA